MKFEKLKNVSVLDGTHTNTVTIARTSPSSTENTTRKTESKSSLRARVP